MDIGVLISLTKEENLFEKMQEISSLGLTACQLCCWDLSLYTEENATIAMEAAKAAGVKITGVWAGWTGPKEWNLSMGPSTLGIVPEAYRFQRVQEILRGADFAAMMGVSDVITHVGYIPENMNDGRFYDVCASLKFICNTLKARGQNFLFETGQETPLTLLRMIEHIGTGNAYVNLDTANLILYGKGNPMDAMDVFGKYVKNTHIKDGVFSTRGDSLGHEVPFGEGKVDFKYVIQKIIELKNDVPLIIEREISGPKQIEDIVLARDGIKKILSELCV